MKVMISYPPLAGCGSPMLTQNRQFQWFHVPSFIYPLVPSMAATLLEGKGFEVVWSDCIAEGWDYDQFISFFQNKDPDVIVFETKTPVVRQHWKIVEQIKKLKPECAIVLMGDHVTALPRESMEESRADYVVTGGDYDISLLGIAEHLREKAELPSGVWYRKNGNIENTGKFSLNSDLDNLPFIDRRLTKAYLYGEKWKKRTPFFYTMVGRDCQWGKCTFCAWTTIYPKSRMRSPDNLLDEIEMLIKEHGAKEIFDDTGTFPAGRWLRDFCAGMIERGYSKEILFSCNMRYGFLKPDLVKLMKRAGFRKVKMGLESANQKTLDLLNKGITVEKIANDSRMISEAGIDIHLTVMVGYPWETKEDVQKTLNLARELMARGHAETLQCTIVIPYPGTLLYRQALENNWFRFDPKEYDRFDMTEPVLKTPGISPQEVMKMCEDVYRSFFNPRYILRRLTNIRGMEDVNYVMRGSKAIMGHILDFMREAGNK